MRLLTLLGQTSSERSNQKQRHVSGRTADRPPSEASSSARGGEERVPFVPSRRASLPSRRFRSGSAAEGSTASTAEGNAPLAAADDPPAEAAAMSSRSAEQQAQAAACAPAQAAGAQAAPRASLGILGVIRAGRAARLSARVSLSRLGLHENEKVIMMIYRS